MTTAAAKQRSFGDTGAHIPVTHHRTAKVDGINIFYREAGPTDAPVVVLLHGFPTSSHMFRNLIPALADRYRVIAPDYPGFGQSDMPDRSQVQVHVRPLRRTRGRAARSARGDELRDVRDGLRRARRLAARAEASRARHRPYRAKRQCLRGRADRLLGSDQSLLGRWLRGASQGAARCSSRRRSRSSNTPTACPTSAASRPTTGCTTRRCSTAPAMPTSSWISSTTTAPTCRSIRRCRRFCVEHRPPTIVVWGKNDKIFPAEGAHPYKRDLPEVEFHLFDTGHFALEDKLDEMVPLIRDFLARDIDKRR